MVPSILLVPMRDLVIEESWHVVGMRGTGSHTVIAKDIFVPAHRALPTEILAQGRSSRTNRDEFVYRELFAPTAIIAVAAPGLGMAQAALELTLERINKSPKAIAYSFYDDLRKAPSMQRELAEAATLIETAVLHVRRWSDDIADAARAGEGLPFAKRAQMRMDLGYAMARCREAVGLLLNVQGASAFAESNPINGSGAIWKWRAAMGCWPGRFRRKSTAARWWAISSRCRRWFEASVNKAADTALHSSSASCEFRARLELEQAFEARVALPGSSDKRLPETFAIRSASMKKFCLAGAAAVLLIGTTAYGFAQSGNHRQKCRRDMRCRSVAAHPVRLALPAMRPAIATWITAARCVTAMTG